MDISCSNCGFWLTERGEKACQKLVVLYIRLMWLLLVPVSLGFTSCINYANRVSLHEYLNVEAMLVERGTGTVILVHVVMWRVCNTHILLTKHYSTIGAWLKNMRRSRKFWPI